jgi:hypothetical protein
MHLFLLGLAEPSPPARELGERIRPGGIAGCFCVGGGLDRGHNRPIRHGGRAALVRLDKRNQNPPAHIRGNPVRLESMCPDLNAIRRRVRNGYPNGDDASPRNHCRGNNSRHRSSCSLG